MSVRKLPSGTRGARPIPKLISRVVLPLMLRAHRRNGDRFNGMDLLYLGTVGARSGERRTSPVARFDEGDGGWYVVASAGGAARHPGWYHNIVAHPEQVTAEVSGVRHRVRVEQLEGAEYDRVWTRITTLAPDFRGYRERTDRSIPVLRLVPLDR
jgi:deazaflavin-dependent oxidoreductase (nitroreductase family)